MGIEYIFPDLKMANPVNNGYQTNDIKYKNLIVFGYQGSGKTEFCRILAEKMAEKYTSQKAVTILSRFFPQLIRSVGLVKVPVQTYVWEDSSLKRQSPEELAAFFNVRHIYAARTGLYNGIITTISNVHDLYAVNKKLRSTRDGIFFRSLPTNEFDKRAAKNFLGEDKFKEFEDIIKRRETDPKLMGITYYNIHGEIGRVDWDLAKKNYLIDIDPAGAVINSVLQSPTTYKPTWWQYAAAGAAIGSVLLVASLYAWFIIHVIRG